MVRGIFRKCKDIFFWVRVVIVFVKKERAVRTAQGQAGDRVRRPGAILLEQPWYKNISDTVLLLAELYIYTKHKLVQVSWIHKCAKSSHN